MPHPRSVGISIAAFAMAVLEGITQPKFGFLRSQRGFQLKQGHCFSNVHNRELQILKCTMGSEMVMVDEFPFPPEVTTTKSLPLLGSGITDIEIHFLQIKHNAIGIYLDQSIVEHLGNWKGKKGSELAADDDFFDALVSARVEKYFRVVVIKEIKGAQFGLQIETAVRDRLVACDKFEDEEDEELERIVQFFQTPYFKKGSVITFYFPASSHAAEITYAIQGRDEVKMKVENVNAAEMIQKWYLGGSRAVSPSTVQSLAEKIGTMLSSA